MESSGHPTPQEAAAILAAVDGGQTSLAASVAVPRLFFATLGLAVTVQIGATAAGIAGAGAAPFSLLLGGNAAFVLVSAIQLARFRSLNGLWLGGLLSRVVGATAAAGGAAYALSGAAWMRTYRSAPAVHSRSEPVTWLVAVVALAVVSLVLLVLSR